jgi:hypothetical protein
MPRGPRFMRPAIVNDSGGPRREGLYGGSARITLGAFSATVATT